ncbi:fatty acid desaturase-domain-containing protein [Cunninghamella echinulata]|nr:fatty acid desaturase-domain-containing protein [Cunninghamella echinulata]
MPPNTEANLDTSLPTPTTHDELKPNIITSQVFTSRVEQGEALFIFENKVYKVDGFFARHPGGELALRHGIGHDVTDEIRSMHPPKVYNYMMKKFYIGEYVSIKEETSPSSSDVPKIQPEQFLENKIQASWGGRISVEAFDEAILEINYAHKHELEQDKQNAALRVDNKTMRLKYQALEQELKQRGLFECNYYRYYKECCRYVLLFYLALWFALRGTCFSHYLFSAICMAGFWHQMVFTAHDAGHNGITGKVEIDHVIGVTIANFIGGLSLGWWKHSHNVHHIVTNDPEHDPDIQHIPFMAVTTRLFENLYSSYYGRYMKMDRVAKFFISRQHHLYYLILACGRFNLHVLSFQYLLDSTKKKRTPTLEWCGILFFFVWYGSLLAYLPNWPIRLMYFVVSYMLTFPLHVQITLSHYGMSTDVIENEPFPAKMLRTTMDVCCPDWLDWFHGGLQFQAVHHLFPRLPRHNLRLCVPHVRQFCRETGLHYYMYHFSTGNGVVLGNFKAVADQVHLLNDVAIYNADQFATHKKLH